MKLPIPIEGLQHIGIAPRDPVKARWFFSEILGLKCEHEETVPSQKVRVSMFPFTPGSILPRLEILEPTADDAPISNFLQKRGGGIHHLAFQIADVQSALDALHAAGIQLIDRHSQPGEGGSKVGFVHPHATGGILVELVSK